MIPPKSEISNCSKPHLLQFSLVGYAGADPYLLNRMLIIRGLADSFYGGCLIQGAARQANYSPYYKKSATVGVNYSLTITLSMVLKGLSLFILGGRRIPCYMETVQLSSSFFWLFTYFVGIA